MGMYDSVMVPCPKCGTKIEFQSKGGNLDMMVYELDEAPSDVLSDINRHAPYCCPTCKHNVIVDIVILEVPRAVAVGVSATKNPKL